MTPSVPHSGRRPWVTAAVIVLAAIVVGVLLAVFALSAYAADVPVQPAVVYDAGGKYDKSFNDAAFDGIERFKKDTGIAYLDFEIANDMQREQALQPPACCR